MGNEVLHFLPVSWADDPKRCRRAGVPEVEIRHRPKWTIALIELDVALDAGAVFDCLLADAEHGKVADFRQGPVERNLRYAVGIQPQQHVFAAAVELRWPEPTGTGHPVLSVETARADALIASLGTAAFHELSWRKGTKGALKAKFAAVRVRVADWPRASSGKRLPGQVMLWLVCERRSTGEK